jgi:CheY-like chemotaxis protein
VASISSPDLLLMDLQRPGTDGHEALLGAGARDGLAQPRARSLPDPRTPG